MIPMKLKPMKYFDPELLTKICCMDEKEFEQYGKKVQPEKNGPYYFKDNGSNVLAVAHLDSVCTVKYGHYMNHPAGGVFFSPTLDDRLGVYTILHLLPAMGIKCDWLLTTGEEKGLSSAEHFKTDKKYNWMFSFDRGGDDVVLYRYDTKKLCDLLRKYEFTPAIGMNSDINYMGHLGISGMNFGVGYYKYHDIDAYAKITEDYIPQVTKFCKFYYDQRNHAMPWEPKIFSLPNNYTGKDSQYRPSNKEEVVRQIPIFSWDKEMNDFRMKGSTKRTMRDVVTHLDHLFADEEDDDVGNEPVVINNITYTKYGLFCPTCNIFCCSADALQYEQCPKCHTPFPDDILQGVWV